MWLKDSSVGRKLVMSITGLFLILFLLFHASMNAVAIIDGDAYNAICAFLGANWYALVGTAILGLGVFVHFACAVYLTILNKKARPQGYSFQKNQSQVEFSSQYMFVLGFIILGFLCLHLYHFWAKMQLVEIAELSPVVINGEVIEPTNGIALIKYTFSNVVTCVLYTVWLLALWFHLSHGVWSAFQTMGLNNKVWFCRLRVISYIFSTFVCGLFLIVVWAAHFCM